MFCNKCGKEIKEGSAFCSECGKKNEGVVLPTSNVCSYASSTNQSAVQKTPYNVMCIIGLVISGISLLLNFWGIVGIAGTIVSVFGLLDSKRKNENGNTLAIFGIVIGVFSIFYGLFTILSLM